MSDASLTNLQMVRPRGPKIFLGMLGIAVLGATAWWLIQPAGPVGEPDDPSKILVVGPDAAETATSLREFGFSTEHGAYDALAAEGAGKAPGKEGIEALLHLADERGFGYVALEDPTSHGLASITVTGDSADVKANHTWAVFSVGDMGMPPKVTVDIEETVMPLPAYVQVLRAAFKQDHLANTLFAESQLPIDAVDLHAKIKVAVELNGSYAMLDRRIDKEHRARTEAEQAEQVEPTPITLAGPMEMTQTVALGDDTVLSFVQAYRLESPRDPDVNIRPSAEIELWYHPPGSTERAERKRCDSLRGGLLPQGGTDHVLSPAADAMLLQSTGGLELWALDVNAKACAFTRKGKIPRAEGYEHTWGEPHGSGRVLRPHTSPEEMGISVWTAGKDRPQIVPMPGCSLLGDPTWLDENHFAVSCQWQPPEPGDYAMDLDDPFVDESFAEDEDEDESQATERVEPPPPPPPEQMWIYVVRLSDSRIVALPGTALGEHTGVYGLHPSVQGPGLDLVATHPWADKLHRVQSDSGLVALFAGAEETFAKLAELDAATAAPLATPIPTAPIPVADDSEVERETSEGEAQPAEVEQPVLRPAFVPAGAMVAALPADALRVSTVEPLASVAALSISPDGTRMVYIPSDKRSVHVRTLDGNASAVLSDNPQALHTGPRFTADGTAVVFTTEYRNSSRTELVGHIVDLDGRL